MSVRVDPASSYANGTLLSFPVDLSLVAKQGLRLRKVTLRVSAMPPETLRDQKYWFVASSPGTLPRVEFPVGIVGDEIANRQSGDGWRVVDVTGVVEYWLDARLVNDTSHDPNDGVYHLQFRTAGDTVTASASWNNNTELIFESDEHHDSCWIRNTSSVCPTGKCANVHRFCIMNVGCVISCGLLCNFETACKQWQWNDTPNNGIRRTLAKDVADLYANHSNIVSGPKDDANGSLEGHYLYLAASSQTVNRTFNVSSQWFNSSAGKCELHFYVHSNKILSNTIQVIINGHNISWVAKSDFTFIPNKWHEVSSMLGTIKQPFQIVIEIVLPNETLAHVALDSIRLNNCASESPFKEVCHERDFHCKSNDRCIDRSYVCDLHEQCFAGEDEKQECDKVPLFARCNFENDDDELCGWHIDRNDPLEWKRHQGPMGRLGTPHDHTYKNSSGNYLYLQTEGPKRIMGDHANFRSPLIRPPPKVHGIVHSPYYNSCQVRFYYYLFGAESGELSLYCIEEAIRGISPRTTLIWSKQEKQGHNWKRAVVTLPRILGSYRLQFEGRRSFRPQINIALDDISLSPECFSIGVNVTDEMLGNNNNTKVEEAIHYTVMHLTTCGGQGRYGPIQAMCDESYRRGPSRIQVTPKDSVLPGIQILTVNDTGFYSVIARGASGGKGYQRTEKSRGAMSRGVFFWHNGEVIHFLIGQEGGSNCHWHGKCRSGPPTSSSGRSRISDVLKLMNADPSSGGGGGGATYVFKIEGDKKVPLLIASGGGGISSREPLFSIGTHGQGINETAFPLNGDSPHDGAGGGGGWNDTTFYKTAGVALLQGSAGGPACSIAKQWDAEGGFGGGGGACLSGGGGGGYKGGNAPDPDSPNKNGHGGTSYVSGDYALAVAGGATEGPGYIEIIPAFEGCDCSYLCVILDTTGPLTGCICPDGSRLKSDNNTCEDEILGLRVQHVVIILICAGVVMAGIAAVSFFFYHRYRRQKMKVPRQELFDNPEFQLNRLRQQGSGGGMVTDPNPNYEFGGCTCTIEDLKQVCREDLTLVNALGQGAFGEVYQGYLRNVQGEVRELPVAVKTLPDISPNQAEIDFLMEALIMSKFTHPNIVRFVGVCFEKLPKFIVLELLIGGDLKSFLRESRPKPGRTSPLTMCDLLMLAMDIAKGCQYLEENHFIHRDIAARNCLLTTKGPDRVVKIADFGMARDIYRNDYYRKGGKAMLPVKWMPPEAFLDGIFTSKTDVWSFGVLLWEVMSLGYMPYPGRGNHEVMQLVTSGGRLEPPSNCPSPVYHIMVQCWNAVPEDRPNFTLILERLGYCLQDPDVMHAALPVFHRPPSTERDTTIMRPPDSDAQCLHVQRPDTEPVSPASTDYLIPFPSSNYSISTEKTELPSGSSVESIDKLLDLEDNSKGSAQPAPSPVASGSAGKRWDVPGVNQVNSQQPPNPEQSSPQSVKRRAGGYTSIPTQEEPVGSPQNRLSREGNPVASSRSPPASIARQRPTGNKITGNPTTGNLISLDNKESAAKSGLSLDASVLARQHTAQPYPYANIDVLPGMGNGGPNTKAGDGKTDPYFIGNHYLDRTHAVPPDKEVSC